MHLERGEEASQILWNGLVQNSFKSSSYTTPKISEYDRRKTSRAKLEAHE